MQVVILVIMERPKLWLMDKMCIRDSVYSVQCRYQTVKFPVGGCGKCHLQFGVRADGGSQVFQFHIPQGQVYPHAAGGLSLIHISVTCSPAAKFRVVVAILLRQ